MYLHPEYPAYEEHIQAVERVLSRHPRLRYVGSHLASLEWSVVELAKRLDQFPNLAVDLAARVDDLQLLDATAVREFLVKYQDRVLYATDLEISEGQDPRAVCARLHARWTEDWKYFATSEETRVGSTEKKVRGLALPGAVLEKIYRANAMTWYPGI
jgi:predicted TIM-barrel fold metal-dependent hydrolase